MDTPVPATKLLGIVQGDVLAGGIPKKTEQFLFFNITPAAEKDFCGKLDLTATRALFSNGADVAVKRAEILAAKAKTGKEDTLPVAVANMSFSFMGLTKV